jgi:hypothetical protein
VSDYIKVELATYGGGYGEQLARRVRDMSQPATDELSNAIWQVYFLWSGMRPPAFAVVVYDSLLEEMAEDFADEEGISARAAEDGSNARASRRAIRIGDGSHLRANLVFGEPAKIQGRGLAPQLSDYLCRSRIRGQLGIPIAAEDGEARIHNLSSQKL